jgi:lipopolysaccharide/colanic/teichoic acid biosynthesis glycosyltransferase
MRATNVFIDLFLVAVGFAAAYACYSALFNSGLTNSEAIVGFSTSVLLFWAAVELKYSGGYPAAAGWVGFIERFCLGTGVNLLAHAILTYAFYTRRTPFLIAAGGVFASILLSVRARSTLKDERSRRRLIFVGFDAIAVKIFDLLSEPLVGILTTPTTMLPAEASCLGEVKDIESVLKEHRPTNIVVSVPDWARQISPSVLLNCRLSGIVVEESSAIYERLFSRVCCERLQPVDVLLSSALRGDSRIMAIQAVYTNLIGVTVLLALLPVMLIVCAAVALMSGAGPVFESTECAGFQYIPFQLFRFRTTRRDGTSTMTGVGRLISKLRLTDLPQLVNVVRGDMALVGPKPVRVEFARYLTGLMPFHSHRFSVKPGIFGWAQLHAPDRRQPTDECSQIEYDLFYIKEASLWLDAEIMLSSLTPVAATSRNSGN